MNLSSAYKNKDSNKGFTLIELLIVIVIVGILAGVLIAVIDPVKQQNRSKNAAVKSSIIKASFAINAAKSGLGTLPDEVDLGTELENLTLGTGCDTAGTLDCTFDIAGTSLPATCGTGDTSDSSHSTGNTQCHLGILSIGSTLDVGHFRVFGKVHKLEDTDDDEAFVFDSSEGLFVCSALSSVSSTSSISGIAGCAPVQ